MLFNQKFNEMVRKMYKCKYLKLPGNHFASNKSDENLVDGVYECGVRRDKLGIYPHRCNDCRHYSPSNVIMPEIQISSYYRIFREPEKYARALDSNQTLGKYHPWRDGMNPNFDSFSEQIYDVKKQKSDAIENFTNQLRDILNDNKEYVICVIPRHQKGTAPSGIRTIAKRLCKFPVIDGTDVIIRTETVKRNSAKGPKRSFELELSTLAIVKEEIIKGKQVLLLDDVATRGNSLNAGRQKLKEVGAILVAAIALGHTQF